MGHGFEMALKGSVYRDFKYMYYPIKKNNYNSYIDFYILLPKLYFKKEK